MEANNNNKAGIRRRDMLKGLATVPFLGALFLAWWNRRRKEHWLNENIFNEIAARGQFLTSNI